MFDDGLFVPEPFTRRDAFLDLVLRAAPETRTVPVNGGSVIIERGQFAASMRTLANRWQWSVGKVNCVLKEFEAMNLIEKATEGHITILSIVNYDQFIGSKHDDKDVFSGQLFPVVKQEAAKTETKTQSTTTPAKPVKRFVRPTVDQVREFCKERGYNIDPESFVDFYESKGWVVGKSPMKDWKAAVRTWVRKDKENGVTSYTPKDENARPDGLRPQG